MKKKCGYCQKEIDSKATRCPYCQADLRSWFRKHPILSFLLFIMLLGMFGSALLGSSTKGKVGSNITPTEEVKIEAEKVDALSFVTEFDQNQLRAEQKYKGRFIEIMAVIKNISEDISGSPFLSLEPVGNKMFGTTIKCVFKDKSALTSVENGNTVTVEGTVANQSLGIIQLNNCNLK